MALEDVVTEASQHVPAEYRQKAPIDEPSYDLIQEQHRKAHLNDEHATTSKLLQRFAHTGANAQVWASHL